MTGSNANLPPHPLGQFFERLGERVIASESTWWHEVQSGVLLSFPYYRELELDDAELTGLIRRHKLRALRYPTPLSGFGFVSTMELNPQVDDYDLACLSSTARRQTKQGLKYCQIERMNFDELIEAGLPLNRDSAERQGRDTIPHQRRLLAAVLPGGQSHAGFRRLGGSDRGSVGCLLGTGRARRLGQLPADQLVEPVSRPAA